MQTMKKTPAEIPIENKKEFAKRFAKLPEPKKVEWTMVMTPVVLNSQRRIKITSTTSPESGGGFFFYQIFI